MAKDKEPDSDFDPTEGELLLGSEDAPDPGETSGDKGQEEEPSDDSAGGQAGDDSALDKSQGDDGGEEEPDGFVPLLEMAELYGISEEDARAYGSPEQLQRTIGLMTQQFAGMGANSRQQNAPDVPASPPQPPPAQPTKPATALPSGQPAATIPDLTAEIEPFKLDISEDALEPEAANAIRAMNEHYRGQLAGIQDRVAAAMSAQLGPLGAVVQQLQLEQQERFAQDVEDWLRSQPDDWKPVLGDGDLRKYAPGTPHAQAFTKVLEQFDLLRSGFRQTRGHAPRNTRLLMDQARDMALAPERQQIEAAKGAKAAGKRRGQATARASSRKRSAPRTPEERRQAAGDSLDRLYREKGIAPAEDGVDSTLVEV